MPTQFCQRCGAPASVGANFCGHCGSRLTGHGFTQEKHYSEDAASVQYLMRENRLEEAEKLLFKLIDATENEARKENCGVAPWYYERLAILYRKKKDKESEIKILERFAAQKHAPGAKPAKLIERLEKLKSQ